MVLCPDFFVCLHKYTNKMQISSCIFHKSNTIYKPNRICLLFFIFDKKVVEKSKLFVYHVKWSPVKRLCQKIKNGGK